MNSSIIKFSLLLACIANVNAQVKISNFGNYTLTNGEVLENTRIGYQTYGKLNPNRDNTVLFATWYAGTGEDLKPYIGKEAMLDTTKYHVVVVEALGNGVSSSPSNTSLKDGTKFPEFNIEDMVDLQHKLLAETLEIDHIYAVTGISMGGMQTYQWMASYPNYFDKAIPIVGTPELSLYEKMNFEIFKQLLNQSMENKSDDATFLMMEYTLGLTQSYFHDLNDSEETFIAKVKEEAKKYDPRNLNTQMIAISNFDPKETLVRKGAKSFTDVFRGDAFIIYSSTDNLLSPLKNQQLVMELKTQSLDLNSKCGHYSFSCDIDQISQAVSVFLN